MFFKAMTVAACVMVSVGAAFAGETTRDQDGALAYRFTQCERPVEPVLATDDRLSGRVTAKAKRRAVSQYNNYVKAIDLYLQCISGEAQADLDAYYAAVTTRLNSEQEETLARARAMRARLTPPESQSSGAPQPQP
ncbi:MAG: hypothetical protein AAGJ87_14250 [Pseudomonadota bacterium]